MTLFLAALFVLIVAGLLYVRFYSPSVPVTDFAALSLKDSPNQYLICPRELCEHSLGQSPVYDLSAGELNEKIRQFVTQKPRITVVNTAAENQQLHFIQRSRLFAFPDLITIQVLDHGDGQSTLAIYSRAVYGRKDFGVNKSRIDRWLEQFTREVATSAG